MSSSRLPAVVALALGLVAILAVPVGGVAAWKTSITLLRASYIAVPVAVAAGLLAVLIARRARLRLQRSVRRTGERIVRASRLIAWSGLYLGVTGALALAFYGVLRSRS